MIWGTLIGTALAFVPYLWHFLTTLEITWARFWREALLPTYPIAAIFAILLFLGNRLVLPDNLWTLAGLAVTGITVYGLMFSVISLSRDERLMFLRAVTLRMQR